MPLETMTRQRKLWVTDAIEWWAETRLAADERRIAWDQHCIHVANWLWSQLALYGKRCAVYEDGRWRVPGH